MSKGSSGLFGKNAASSQKAASKTAKKAKKTKPSGLTEYQKGLIKEVKARGDKITSKNVIDIGKSKDGRIIWIETGKPSAGLKHILGEHGEQFAQDGFTARSLSKFLVKTVLTKQPVGYTKTGNKTPRAVYKVTVNGKTKYIAISIGPNGFIVGANYVGERKIKWNKK